MRSRNDHDRHDHRPQQGHRDDRLGDHARQYGARDGEAGSFLQRRFAEPRIFERDDVSYGHHEAARPPEPRYERDEGFDRDQDNALFAEDAGRSDRATSDFGPRSQRRAESFVDAYQRWDERGQYASRPLRSGPHERGFEDQALYENRAYAHHLAGVPSYEAAHGVERWNRWPGRRETPRAEASTHPSPYTPYIGPLADREGEVERGWSGQQTSYGGRLGGAFRNPAWEVPFERPQTTWGDRPHLGKGPRGYVRSDERIREEVCDCLSEGYVDASRVEVDVKSGVVLLTGQVPDKMSKRRIEDITEACRGVLSVDNQMRVQSVTRRGDPAVSLDGASLDGEGGNGAKSRSAGRDKSVS